MNADRRIVPEKHISYLLEEEHIPERTKAIKHRLIRSPKKIDKVAEHWVESTGINSLARVMLKNVSQVPHTRAISHTETTKHTHKVIPVTTPSVAHAVHKASGNTHHPTAHDDHHGVVDHHAPDHNSHHEAHTSHHTDTDAHGHGEHHDTHGHQHHDNHGHHGHGHGSHGGSHGHEHHGGHFSSFMSSGHWCGQQGARIFALVGRIVGEIIGYIIKTLIVAILFGPTRTAILVFCMSIFLNTTMDTSLPVGIAASIAGIIHLIFTGIGMIGGSGGHGEGGHGGGGHGHH